MNRLKNMGLIFKAFDGPNQKICVISPTIRRADNYLTTFCILLDSLGINYKLNKLNRFITFKNNTRIYFTNTEYRLIGKRLSSVFIDE